MQSSMSSPSDAKIQIGYPQLQYRREKELYQDLRPVLDDLGRTWNSFSKRNQQHEKEFFRHLSHSVRIDGLPQMVSLLKSLNDHLKTNFKINLFLYQSPVTQASCMPRYGTSEQEKSKELVILASQHFLNELQPPEQICILGHELAHLVYGHVHIPGRVLLQSDLKTNLRDIKDLKSQVMKWLICAEISCDILSYVAGAFDLDAFNSAMIKYTTGLKHSTFFDVEKEKIFLVHILRQFDDIASSHFDSMLSTHPLTPLRLKIVTSITQSTLIQNFGRLVSRKELDDYSKDFNDIVDDAVQKIYPEIITKGSFKHNDILLKLGIAVALTDGKIDEKELEAICQIIRSKLETKQAYVEIRHKLAQQDYRQIVKDIVKEAVEETRQRKFDNKDFMFILRHLLIVAATDGLVEVAELDTIYSYAREFGFDKSIIKKLLAEIGLAD